MSKILFSAVVGDARGKTGGVVFSKSRFGAITRRKVSPVQPRTSYQTGVRSLFTLLSKNWSSVLTQAQRNAWIALAANNPQTNVFGNTYIMTGLQMYQLVNRNLQTIGVTLLADPPTDLSVGSPGSITLASSAGPPITLTATPDTDPGADDVPVYFAVAPVNAGRIFTHNRERYIGQDAAATAGPFDVAADYAAKYGALVAGQNVTVGVKYISNATGGASLLATSQIVIA